MEIARPSYSKSAGTDLKEKQIQIQGITKPEKKGSSKTEKKKMNRREVNK